MKRLDKVLLVLVVISLFVITACEGEDVRTSEEKCNDYAARYFALAQCDNSVSCRLNDREYYEYKDKGLLMLQYCKQAQIDGGTADKEVQPKEPETKT